MPTVESARAILWLTPDQAPFLREVMRRAGLTPAGAGSPTSAHTGGVAAALECPPLADLRAALHEGAAGMVIIAAPGDFGAREADAGALVQARARGVQVASFEPIPHSPMDLARDAWKDPSLSGLPTLIGLASRGRAFRGVREALEHSGAVRTASVECVGSAAHGTLAGRLFGALEWILAILGEPESVSATYVSPLQTRGARESSPESLRELHGDVTGNVRFADGRSATFLASDHAGEFRCRATLVGESGCLRVDHRGFRLVGVGGEVLDESTPDESEPGSAAEVFAQGLRELSTPGAREPVDLAGVLATAQACLLSARTRQSEHVATIQRMVESVR